MAARCMIIVVLLVLFLLSCKKKTAPDKDKSTTLFEKLNADKTGVTFINEVEDGKDFNILTYRNFYNGGGVAIGDINNDSLPDIYFTANMQPNRLYLNKGNWKFEDITDKAGVAGRRKWSTGVVFSDVNGDGWLDIYVANSGYVEGDDRANELFINNGDLTFTENAHEFNLDNKGITTHASFFDYDLDGDLDCFILNNSFKDPERKNIYRKTREENDSLGGDKLFRNDENYFVDVTNEANIFNSPNGFGLGVSISDLNGDIYPDIYISNDFWERDYLYFNNGDGTFREELTSSISVCSISSMGADVADLNNDGKCDIFCTDMLPATNYRLKTMTMFDPFHVEDKRYRQLYHYQILQNCLQINQGHERFQELAHLSGVSSTDWSWGALIFDFDNNGWKDILVCNGIYREIMYQDFNKFITDKEAIKKVVTQKGEFDWRDFVKYIPSNPLSNFAFVNSSSSSSIPIFNDMASELGLGEPGFSNGAAYGDLDNDGDLDLVINNVNMEAFLFKNNATNNYLKIRFNGNERNKFGVGAKVIISANGHEQVMQFFPSRGFESSVEPGLVFGLGNATTIDTLKVIWPDLSFQILKNVSANQTLTLSQESATGRFVEEDINVNPIFKNVTAEILQGNHTHVENIFNDYESEILLPRPYSTEGPPIIKGDINGDGLEDLIMGGAANDPDKYFLQNMEGKFYNQPNQIISLNELAGEDKKFETTCGAIFDADNDGDNDILLGSGGNEFKRGINHFLLRYYENRNGEFVKATSKTPPAAGNFSCIKSYDFDSDGDLDLFIGGRIVPGNYGLPPRSFLFRNEGGGNWTDITNKEIGMAGMITDAVWSDTDRDGDKDLIVVGEWAPIIIFENKNGVFSVNKSQTNSRYMGWWNTIEAVDLDRDGDDDYILGNWGLNSKLKASPKRSLSMYVKDFDQNNKTEPILIWYPPGDSIAYPFASKVDITEQLPSLEKSNLQYKDYALKTYETLFTKGERDNAIPYNAYYLESSILWNEEDGLSMEALPIEAQVAPIFAIVADDMDNDGAIDIWLGGNLYGLKPEMGWMNSSRGIFLRGDGTGKFTYVSPDKAGINITGQVRDATFLYTKQGRFVVIARNNLDALVYRRIDEDSLF